MNQKLNQKQKEYSYKSFPSCYELIYEIEQMSTEIFVDWTLNRIMVESHIEIPDEELTVPIPDFICPEEHGLRLACGTCGLVSCNKCYLFHVKNRMCRG